MRLRQFLSLLMSMSIFMMSGSSIAADGAAPLWAVHVGLGASAGLESGRTSTSGLAVQASAMVPIYHTVYLGLAMDRHESGLRSTADRETEFETTSLAALLAYRLEGAAVAGYLRTGLGAAYTHRSLVKPGPGSSFAILEDGEDFAPCGQLAIGVEMKLASPLSAFADFGVYQVWGNLSHTSGALVLGVGTGW